jgi:formylglycine-generating enzyme required for sulfatase activity
MFRERWLYDMDSFDTTLFDREDLRWIRFTYVLVLRFAWDREYHNARAGASTFEGSLGCFDRLLGKTDGFILWPTWPRLGLDGRNQFDLFADLPGGFDGLRRQAEYARAHGTKFFVCHNPWDTGTRSEDHLAGLERLLRGTDADGVVLDTRGASDRQLQQTADRVKPGIVLYSEGMAVPKEMPGIVAGRVHDALVLPPPLNLNKVIRPDFAIFRVLQLADGRLHREAGIALFNGHGVEINVMRPGSPAWLDEELRYLGRTVRILREHSSAFLSHDWTPLFPAAADSIWVNRWATPEKTLYTIFSLRPDGWSSPLFVLPRKAGAHLVDVWNHTELPHTSRGDSAAVTVEGFSRSWLGSRREGNVGCIALLPQLLTVSLDGDSLSLSAPRGDSVLVWAGDPAYDGSPSVFRAGSRTVSLRNFMGFYEGKVVVQLFDGGELADERIVEVPPGTPRLVSTRQATLPAGATPPGMMEIPAGRYVRAMTGTDASDSFFPVPGRHGRDTVCMPRFWMDRYPVTNEEFRAFLLASGYTPDDTTNFLRHWSRGHPPRGMEQHPVVWVSYDDARAFARWAGKRLPTSFEWQYAAQGSDGRRYPWGDSLEAGRYNPGTGTTSPVNRYPSGASPFGVADMVGNVWQLMDELYSDGRYTFGILRGGSYYAPAGSEWYIRGGPRPVDRMQILLMVSPGFDRSATVGFRCVRDAE